MFFVSMLIGVCALFERDLKEKYPHQRELTYDVGQLFGWIDQLVIINNPLTDSKALVSLI